MKRRLRDGADVTTAMLDAGYGSSSRFYERAAPKLGMLPTTYRKGGEGMSIRFAIVDSPLRAPAGRRHRSAGCARSRLAHPTTPSSRRSRREYPAAEICPGLPARLGTWTRGVLEHLGGRVPRLELPLDIQATAFQWQVWKALGSIPYGETRSYSEIARAIGRPKAARAVARACAATRVALAIPCHRVVPAAGGVGGYRWGAARKKTLLAREHPPVK